MSLTLYTFANEAYVPAVAALINSARQTGFTGRIHVGSPEPLSIEGRAGENVIFHVLGKSLYWPGNRKAELVLAHPSERFLFLDADMIVNDGAFLQRVEYWINIAPVFAIEGLLAPIDYRRHMWAKRLGHTSNSTRWPMHYFNSGLFAGLFERDRPLIEAWDLAIRTTLAAPSGLFCDLDFPMADQDILNATLQDTEPQPIGIGPPDIWAVASPVNPFLHVGTFQQPAVFHCTGQAKPWKIRQLPNRWPNAYDLAWYKYVVVRPTPVLTRMTLRPLINLWFKQHMLARYCRLFRSLCGP